jgi:hypothetical protein
MSRTLISTVEAVKNGGGKFLRACLSNTAILCRYPGPMDQ